MTRAEHVRGLCRESRRGFSLVEVLVSTAVGAMILAGVLGVTLFLVRSGIRMAQVSEMDAQIRRTVEKLGSDLRVATGMEWRSSTELVVTVPDVTGVSLQYTYVWSGTSETLSVVPGTDAAATAGRVRLLSYVPTQADGTAGVVFARFDKDGVATSNDAKTKTVRVTIVALRRTSPLLTAVSANTSASYVLRNKGVTP